jgi:cell division protein FtsL
MRDLSLTFSQVGTRRKINSLSVQQLNLAILAAIGILAVTYLFVVTSLGTRGYEIRNLEQQVRTLQETQKHLQLQSSDLQSITRIQTDAAKFNFVPSTSVTYLKDSDFALK